MPEITIVHDSNERIISLGSDATEAARQAAIATAAADSVADTVDGVTSDTAQVFINGTVFWDRTDRKVSFPEITGRLRESVRAAARESTALDSSFISDYAGAAAAALRAVARRAGQAPREGQCGCDERVSSLRMCEARGESCGRERGEGARAARVDVARRGELQEVWRDRGLEFLKCGPGRAAPAHHEARARRRVRRALRRPVVLRRR